MSAEPFSGKCALDQLEMALSLLAAISTWGTPYRRVSVTDNTIQEPRFSNQISSSITSLPVLQFTSLIISPPTTAASVIVHPFTGSPVLPSIPKAHLPDNRLSVNGLKMPPFRVMISI